MFPLIYTIFTIIQLITKLYCLMPHHCMQIHIAITLIDLLALVEMYKFYSS
jgi:hypothetical protein